MSLKTRINGFTAWANLRLVPYDTLLTNVLLDLTKGCHVQQLLHSLTGKNMKKLQSLDGLTQAQKVTRLEWMVEELKKSEVLPDEVKIECRLVAAKAADHVFDLLWRLVAHDIWFTWERMEFLQLDDDKLLSEIPFQWTPDPPPKKKKKRVTRTADSMMFGFGSSSQVVEDPTPSPEQEEYEQFPGADKMKAMKSHLPRGGWYSYPSPDECIIDMINSQLQRVSEGHKFTVFSLDDLVDSRALCGMVNAFIPGTFTTEVMLNDRWTINLALSVIGKMLRASNPMGSGDLSEADPKSICSFMCFFFMSAFKLRQSKAVIRRRKELTLLVQEVDNELSKLQAETSTRLERKAKRDLESRLDELHGEQELLAEVYDIEYMEEWLEHIRSIQLETRKIIAVKMKERFDLIRLPRSMTINDLCMSVAINLQLTQGAGFYRVYDKEKETCTPDRRIVLRDKKTKEFVDDFTGVEGSCNIRDLLGIPRYEVTVIDPSNFPQYEFYLESNSRNKTLRVGTIFLYQVFPGSTIKWQRLFFKAVRDGEFDIVKKMVLFFKESHPNFISSKDSDSGNTVLHMAAKFGHFNISKYLLENGCNVNARNNTGCSPLFFAAEGLHKRVAQLLIEWGCDLSITNFRCQTALDVMRHDEMRDSLKEIGRLWAMTVPQVVRGRLEPLRRIVKDHLIGIRKMADISARCIKGSTLLHTAVHFADIDAMKDLFKTRVDANLQDYQGATPLHRAKDVATLELILDSNGEVNAADYEGNTALHVRAYGEESKASFLEGIKLLMSRGGNVIHRNNKELMPVHCAAMQGRSDVIELMLQESGDLIKSEIDRESNTSPPSLPYLAVAANHVECAKWLVERDFRFKDGECNRIMYKIFTQDITLDDRADTARFLLQNGGDVNLKYKGGDSSVHLATRMSGSIDVLLVLLEFEAEVDAINDTGCSPLFDAMKSNNFHAASTLIEQGADIRRKNDGSLTPLDLIHDFDEWISCPLFTDDVTARFKAYKLKHARDLVRAITRKLQQEAQKARVLLRKAGHYNQPPLALSMQSFDQYSTTRGIPLKTNNKYLTRSLPGLAQLQHGKDVTSSRPQHIKFERRLALPPVAIPQSLNHDSPQLI